MNMHSVRLHQPLQTREILSRQVAAIGWEDAISHLREALASRRFTKVAFLNAHAANIACGDSKFADALDDFLVLPDGVGVDVASKLLYGSPFPANLNGTDFVPALLQSEPRSLTVGLLGATRRNIELAADRLRQIAPQHRFEIVSDGYFSEQGEAELVRKLRALRPDILLVAMGVPRQELWIARALDASCCTMPMAVGALLDFLSGAVPRAPLPMRRLRLEWLFRLLVEPGRLWRRYLVGNPVFLFRVLRLMAGRRIFSTSHARR